MGRGTVKLDASVRSPFSAVSGVVGRNHVCRGEGLEPQNLSNRPQAMEMCVQAGKGRGKGEGWTVRDPYLGL